MAGVGPIIPIRRHLRPVAGGTPARRAQPLVGKDIRWNSARMSRV